MKNKLFILLALGALLTSCEYVKFNVPTVSLDENQLSGDTTPFLEDASNNTQETNPTNTVASNADSNTTVNQTSTTNQNSTSKQTNTNTTVNQTSTTNQNSTSKQTNTNTQTKQVDYDKAVSVSLNHAGVNRSDVYDLDVELEYYKNQQVISVEFECAQTEYDYYISINDYSVIDCIKKTETVTVQAPTQTQPTQTQPTQSQPVDEIAKAKQVAFNHAGVSASSVYDLEVEQDYEHGVRVIEVSFKVGNYEYEYEINASNFSIIKFDKEYDD